MSHGGLVTLELPTQRDSLPVISLQHDAIWIKGQLSKEEPLDLYPYKM